MGNLELVSAQGGRTRAAIVISAISNPLFVALPTFFIIALYSAPDIFHALLWWAITVLGISIAPYLFIRRGVKQGRYSDHHISRREQRFVPLLFGLACMVISFVLLFSLHVSRSLIAAVVAVMIVCILALLITRYWKISLHLVGIAGAITAFVLMFGWRFFCLAPLVLLVAWARWQVRAHTVWQAVAGTVLAICVTLAVFLMFRL